MQQEWHFLEEPVFCNLTASSKKNRNQVTRFKEQFFYFLSSKVGNPTAAN